MTDELDRAAELETAERAAAIERARARPAAGDWRLVSAKWCEGPGCGERIPDERRRALPGVRLCVDCQQALERQERRTGW